MYCTVAGLVLVLVVVMAVLVGGKVKQQHQVAILVAARCNRVRKLKENFAHIVMTIKNTSGYLPVSIVSRVRTCASTVILFATRICVGRPRVVLLVAVVFGLLLLGLGFRV